MKQKSSPEITLILHNIRSTHNVGSIFRTADACGVSKIYLSGYTPTPLDRFGRPRTDIEKTALGAEKTIFWQQLASPTSIIAKLKKEGAMLIAIEQSSRSVDYKKVNLSKEGKVVILVGNEVKGLSPSILKKCDIVAEIPMKGKKESLNVSVAFGVALFRMLGI